MSGEPWDEESGAPDSPFFIDFDQGKPTYNSRKPHQWIETARKNSAFNQRQKALKLYRPFHVHKKFTEWHTKSLNCKKTVQHPDNTVDMFGPQQQGHPCTKMTAIPPDPKDNKNALRKPENEANKENASATTTNRHTQVSPKITNTQVDEESDDNLSQDHNLVRVETVTSDNSDDGTYTPYDPSNPKRTRVPVPDNITAITTLNVPNNETSTKPYRKGALRIKPGQTKPNATQSKQVGGKANDSSLTKRQRDAALIKSRKEAAHAKKPKFEPYYYLEKKDWDPMSTNDADPVHTTKYSPDESSKPTSMWSKYEKTDTRGYRRNQKKEKDIKSFIANVMSVEDPDDHKAIVARIKDPHHIGLKKKYESWWKGARKIAELARVALVDHY